MERREIVPLADKEIPLFLAAIENSPMRNAYALCLFAGLREGECLGLSWSQVDFQKRRIIISQQLQGRQGDLNTTSPPAQKADVPAPSNPRQSLLTICGPSGRGRLRTA